jgi:hypothetical protein
MVSKHLVLRSSSLLNIISPPLSLSQRVDRIDG